MRYNLAMRILGIETSCDETAVCLIEAEGNFPGRTGGPSFRWKTLGNALISQAAMHAEFGGVFPNLAKREHAKNLVPLLQKTLNESGLLRHSKPRGLASRELSGILEREPELLAQLVPFLEQNGKPDIDAIAVTYGPGLEPALWVGVNFAKALSLVWNIPMVAVNHMEGHIILSMMGIQPPYRDLRNPDMGKLAEFEFPVLALLISGGHTELVLSKEFGRYELIGQTRDDAAGEAFDKVARLLDLPYPGGPEISKLASIARESNLRSEIKLPRPMMREDNFYFSFSGLKTAVRKIVEAHPDMSPDDKKKLAREFEDAVSEVLVTKTMRASEEFGVNTIVVGGGVSANKYIREQLAVACQLQTVNCKLLIPPPELATDNAIMIALAGYFQALKKDFADSSTLRATGNLKLAPLEK